MTWEAVLLTGGQSSRMGFNKSLLDIAGRPLGEHLVDIISEVVTQVTVLGHSPIGSARFQPDTERHGGALKALSEFSPEMDAVFVCACDMPLLNSKLIEILQARLEIHETDHAIVPIYQGQWQPLCALYRSSALRLIPTVLAEGHKSLMAWLDTLWVETIDEADLLNEGVNPRTLESANTPEKWASLVAEFNLR